MKVFWSWQSDTPGNIGRFFVRDALKEAIKELQATAEIEEPIERDTLEQMHFDQGRQNVAGSPDLANTIMDKIAASAVVLADVTPIGVVGNPVVTPEGVPKKLINSNVAIERVLLVWNTHYGRQKELPFDIVHKGGGLAYSLPPGADKKTIAAEAKKLRAQLVEALRLCFAKHIESIKKERPFPKQPPGSIPEIFFKWGEQLAEVGAICEPTNYYFQHQQLAFMRLFPLYDSGRRPKPLDLKKLFDKQKIGPMSLTNGAFPSRNQYGPISYMPRGQGTISALTQGFATGELWGLNSEVFFHGVRNDFFDTAEIEYIPVMNLEQLFLKTAFAYVNFLGGDLGLKPPFGIWLGLVGIRDKYLGFPPQTKASPANFFSNERILVPSFERKYSIDELKDKHVFRALTRFFDEFYELVSLSRSEIIPEAWAERGQVSPLAVE
jgi:hypothetical protein